MGQQLDDASPHGDRDGVGPMVRAELGQNSRDMHLDRRVADGQSIRDALVRGARGHQPQDFDLSARQRFIRRMFGQPRGNFRGDPLPSRLHRTNGIEELMVRVPLQHVRARTGLERPQRPHIPGVAGQHDIRSLAS